VASEGHPRSSARTRLERLGLVRAIDNVVAFWQKKLYCRSMAGLAFDNSGGPARPNGLIESLKSFSAVPCDKPTLIDDANEGADGRVAVERPAMAVDYANFGVRRWLRTCRHTRTRQINRWNLRMKNRRSQAAFV
jgi:hypothetical protein